jgi:glycolate dehydrogenase FAD-binding subunit
VSELRVALQAAFGASALHTARARPDGPDLPMVVPGDLETTAEVVRYCARERLALVPLGLGSKLGWCAPPSRVDVLLSTRALTCMVSHEPGDGTLTAQAGMTMAELRERAASGGHWVTPDVPRPERATLGGVLAASQSGPDRLRHGPARHHVLGMKVVLADGSLAKSGGQLVKNVTGYDLHRLHCGSHGTLSVIVEASLRLFPLPEHEVALAIDVATNAEMLGQARLALALPLRLQSLSASSSESGWSLLACLAGRRVPVEGESASLAQAWPSARVLAGAAAREAACSARDAAFATASPSFHIACRPVQLRETLELVESALAKGGLGARRFVEPGIATLDVHLPAEAEPRRIAETAAELRRRLADMHVAVVLRDAPARVLDALDPPLDPLGDSGPSLALMRRLKDKLDPDGVFARDLFGAR